MADWGSWGCKGHAECLCLRQATPRKALGGSGECEWNPERWTKEKAWSDMGLLSGGQLDLDGLGGAKCK